MPGKSTLAPREDATGFGFSASSETTAGTANARSRRRRGPFDRQTGALRQLRQVPPVESLDHALARGAQAVRGDMSAQLDDAVPHGLEAVIGHLVIWSYE